MGECETEHSPKSQHQCEEGFLSTGKDVGIGQSGLFEQVFEDILFANEDIRLMSIALQVGDSVLKKMKMGRMNLDVSTINVAPEKKKLAKK